LPKVEVRPGALAAYNNLLSASTMTHEPAGGPQHDADRCRHRARLTLALNERRMPAIKALWPRFAGQAGKDGWPTARFLGALVEHKLAEPDRRRIERHVSQARLLPGKTIDTFGFAAVPMLSKAHVNAVTAGDSGIGKAD
jgi:DNA replication protein DnaC